MANHYYKINKKGTVLLLIASLGFLIASIWLMQSQIKPKNIGTVEFDSLKLGNEGQNELFYIDQSAEYSLKNALEIKSRNYKTGDKTYTNREVCNLQLDACRDGKPDCKTNLKVLCEDEVLKAFKDMFAQYLQTLNKETTTNIGIEDYQFETKTITSDTTAKIREIQIIGRTIKTLQSKEGDVEYNIKPNFKTKTKL
jgi:hypothetical protein